MCMCKCIHVYVHVYVSLPTRPYGGGDVNTRHGTMIDPVFPAVGELLA